MRPCCRNFKLRPILECVFPCGVGRFTAVFGYQNDEGRTLVLPAGGPDNFFRPAPRRRGQPSRFLPGRHRNVFSVHGINAVTWTLGNRTLRARPDFAPCETDFAATDAPLALLPVRLETRFFPFEQTPTHLLVRIYPDDIHVESHEPGLTQDEQTFGTAFWADFGAPGDGAEADQRRRQAWAVLADRYGARRAAWIGKVLAPNAPAPAARDSSWTRAATTEALPTRWVALGYRGGQRIFAVWGNRLPTVLQVGPSPDPTPSDDGVEPEIKWMSDFDEAERVGMGIRVPLTGNTTLGFDRVVVLGSQGGCDRQRAGEVLASLLEGHHYTTGLAVIPQTTPTNNTVDAPSGFSSEDPGHVRSYAAERGDPLFEPNDGRDGDVLSSLLGLRPETFFHVEGADSVDQQDARSMNAALWEVTLGYFFKQWVPGTASESELALLRRHFIDNVRGRGPLPLLRASRQPYGILPTTSLDLFKPLEPGVVLSPGFTRARTQLTFMRNVWTASVPFIPRVGTTADAAAALEQLVQALSMEPVSGGAEGRFVFGQRYVTFINDFLGLWADSIFGGIFGKISFTASSFFQQIANTVLGVLTQLAGGLPILGATYAPQPFALAYALTGTTPPTAEELARQPSGVVSTTEPYSADTNVFTAALSNTYQQLRQFTWPAAAGITALLPRLVRNSKLLEYAAISGALQVERGLLAPSAVRDPELVDIGTTGTLTLGRILDSVIPGLTAPATVGAYLDTLTLPPAIAPTTDPRLANLLEFLAAAAQLEGRPTAALDLAFRELMDVCSHRIDAWMASIATARIRELRKKAPDGIYLGGYGWVENLKPSVRQNKPEGGFLLAPSLNHATAAAILRNGRLSHNPTAVDRAFAVDLSSRRVRVARSLADGIRQGNSLAAMLGYELERGLKENYPGLFLQAILPDLRQLAPLTIGKIPDHAPVGGTPSIEDLGARNVVDGLQARELFHNGGLAAFLAGLTAAQKAAVAAEIARLDDMVDALGDLSLSESIYQLAIGNHERAAAAMNAFGNADVAPPQFQVLETPRSGVANTHRLTVLLTGAATVPSSWGPGGATSARAKAEPQLNAWAAKLIGDPSRVEARVDFLDAASQPLTPPVSAAVKLSDLGLAPLDVLEIARPGEAGAPADLERLWANRVLSPPPAGVPPDVRLRFDFGRNPAWDPSRVSVGELFELARRIRELHGTGRAVTPEDLDTPGAEPSGFDLTELAARADAAIGALQTATTALAAIDPATATLAAIRSALQALVPFGVPGAIPALPAADEEIERAALGRQVPFVLAGAQRRVDKHAALVAAVEPTLPTLPEARVAAYHEDRLKIVLGAGFRALARLTPANAAVLAQAAAAGDATQAATPFAALTWFQRVARVRDGAGKLDDVLFYAETLGTGDAPHLQILQLPVEADDPWIGLPLPAGKTAKAGRVSIIAHAPNGPLGFSGPVSGLVIDDWLDLIPNAEETAGVAFHYDRPNSTAPQAILLAVTPVPQALWDLASLEAVVLETLDLVKIRAVDPHVVRGAGHVLPALYFAHNLANDTVSLGTTATP